MHSKIGKLHAAILKSGLENRIQMLIEMSHKVYETHLQNMLGQTLVNGSEDTILITDCVSPQGLPAEMNLKGVVRVGNGTNSVKDGFVPTEFVRKPAKDGTLVEALTNLLLRLYPAHFFDQQEMHAEAVPFHLDVAATCPLEILVAEDDELNRKASHTSRPHFLAPCQDFKPLWI